MLRGASIHAATHALIAFGAVKPYGSRSTAAR
jgi:hypothetical protein